MLKNTFNNLKVKTLLSLFLIFLAISAFGNVLIFSNKIYANNPSPSFNQNQVNSIKNDPTKYISFHWGNSESIYMDFNLPGYNGVKHLLLFDTNGAVNFLANQTKYYSNDFCGGNPTGININAYSYYSKSNTASGHIYGETQSFKVWYTQTGTVNSGCKSINIQPKSGKMLDFRVNNPSNAGLFMQYKSNAISMLDNGSNSSNFKLVNSNNKNVYLLMNSTQSCSDRLVINYTASNPTTELYEYSNSQYGLAAGNLNSLSDSGGNTNVNSVNRSSSNAQSGSNCAIDSIKSNSFDPNRDLSGNVYKLPFSSDGLGYNFTGLIENLPQLKTNQKDSTAIVGTSQSQSKSSPPTCESASSGLTLGWIMCPIINWLTSGISDIEGFIQDYLKTPPVNLSNPASDPYTNALYGTWNIFRNIANVVLVIVVLVVVFGESVGGGLIDAYSIRKILPRIIVGAILINISFYILVGLEDITNILGGGVNALLTDPFKSSIGSALTISSGGSASIFTFVGTAIMGALVVNGAIAFIGLAALSAFLAALIVLITLVLRQALLVLLIVVSPVAFALYILPNTQNVFKKWWDLLIKALLMYPIIMAFFAMGLIGAYVVRISSNNGSYALSQILEVIAIILPLFLVPQAFKMAGGAIGGLHGALTGLGHKQFLANARKQNRQKRINRAMSGDFADKGIGKMYNRIGTGARAGWRGRFGVGETGRSALALDGLSQNEETLKSNSKLAQLRNNDDANAVMALSGGTREGAEAAARQLFTKDGKLDQNRFNNAMSTTVAVGYSRANASAALQTLAQNKSRAIGDGRYDIVQDGINRLAGRNGAHAESLAQQFQFLSREAGRGDIGGMWTNQAVQDRATNLERTMGISREEAMRHAVSLDAMERMDPVSMVRGHTAQVKQFASTARAIYAAAKKPTASPELKAMGLEAASRLLELNKGLPYASGAGQEIINDAMYSKEANIDYASKESIEQQLARGLGSVSEHVNGKEVRRQIYSEQELSRMTRTYDRESAQMVGGPADLIPPQPK